MTGYGGYYACEREDMVGYECERLSMDGHGWVLV